MSAPTVLVMKQVWRHPAWVSKGELGSGVWALPPTNHPHVGRPAGHFVELGQLDDLGPLSDRNLSSDLRHLITTPSEVPPLR